MIVERIPRHLFAEVPAGEQRDHSATGIDEEPRRAEESRQCRESARPPLQHQSVFDGIHVRVSSGGRTSISPNRNEAKTISPPARIKVTEGIAMRIIATGSSAPKRARAQVSTEYTASARPPTPRETPSRMPRSKVKTCRKRASVPVMGSRFFNTPTVRAMTENSTSCKPRIVAPAA